MIPASFYSRDTRDVACELLGCLLCRRESDGRFSFGRIVETEAYIGESDPACHAAAGVTPRTRILYGPPGKAYVYFNYGMHHLLNAVTEPEGSPAAVLIRAVEPLGGISRMEGRRGRRHPLEIASGPGRLCQALDIDLDLNGTSLTGPVIQIRDTGERPDRILSGSRVGIRVGTDRPWRFWDAGSPHVSRGSGAGAPAGSRSRSTADS